MTVHFSPGNVMAKGQVRVRKNMRLSQAKLTRAQRILGTATETDTVEQALDLVAFREEVTRGIRRLGGSRILRDVLGDPMSRDH